MRPKLYSAILLLGGFIAGYFSYVPSNMDMIENNQILLDLKESVNK